MYFIKLLLAAMIFEIASCLGISEKEESKTHVEVVSVAQQDTAHANEIIVVNSKSPRVVPIVISLP